MVNAVTMEDAWIRPTYQGFVYVCMMVTNGNYRGEDCKRYVALHAHVHNDSRSAMPLWTQPFGRQKTKDGSHLALYPAAWYGVCSRFDARMMDFVETAAWVRGCVEGQSGGMDGKVGGRRIPA